MFEQQEIPRTPSRKEKQILFVENEIIFEFS